MKEGKKDFRRGLGKVGTSVLRGHESLRTPVFGKH